MPNCDFYACRQDHRAILDYLLQSGCRIFQLSSDTGQPVKEFTELSGIERAYSISSWQDTQVQDIMLQPLAPDAGQIRFLRVDFDARQGRPAAFRYDSAGWGLIQLYLRNIRPEGLPYSHTNHNSEKRAQAWAGSVHNDLGSPSEWDWKTVTAFSRKLNSFIRKYSVDKDGSRPIFPAAHKAFAAGVNRLLN